MPSTAEWLAANPNIMGSMTAGSNFIDNSYEQMKKAQDDQAQAAAGKAFVAGDYAGATAAYGNSGDVANAQKMQATGQAANSAGMQYLAKALPVLTQIAKVHAAEGPQAQSAALVGAFDHIAPEAKQLTGISDQVLMGLRQSLASDPQGTLERLQSMVPVEWKTVGDTAFGMRGNDTTPVATLEGSKYMAQPAGSAIVQVGGPQGQPGAAQPNSAPPPQGAPAAGSADPSSVSAAIFGQESSSGAHPQTSVDGAVGPSQILPSTATQYGLDPSKLQNPQYAELARNTLIAKLSQDPKIGNDPVRLAVAYFSGAGNVAPPGSPTPYIRDTKDGNGKFVSSYVADVQKRLGGAQTPAAQQPQPQMQGGARVVTPAQPSFIPMSQAGAAAQKNFPGAIGIEAGGKPMYPPANASTVADSSLGTPDTQSNSILAATGLPYEAFLTLTGQASKLPRDKTTRSVAFKTATDFSNKRGVDVSSFASQYDAYNKVLLSNIERYSNTRVMEGELQGTIANIKPVADAVGMGKVRLGNVLQAAAGGEVNDPLVQQYRFQLHQLRSELAGYNGALQGRSGSGLTKEDYSEAENVIKNGMSSGSAAGLQTAVAAATQKMSGVLQNNIQLTNRAIWNLFGVGKQFDRLHPPLQQQSSPSRAPSAPRVGAVIKGYRFKGGDPANQASWVKAQ